jgi:hypothetical protein
LGQAGSITQKQEDALTGDWLKHTCEDDTQIKTAKGI